MPIELTDFTVQQFTQALQNFTQTVEGGAFAAGGSRQTGSRAGQAGGVSTQTPRTTEDRKLQKILQDTNETIKTFGKMQKAQMSSMGRDLKDYSRLAGSMFEKAITNLKAHQLDAFVDSFNQELNKIDKAYESQIKTIGELEKKQAEVAATAEKLANAGFKELHAKARDLLESYNEETDSREKLDEQLDDLGVTVEEASEEFDELVKKTKDATTAMGKAAEQGALPASQVLNQFAGKVQNAAMAVGLLGGALNLGTENIATAAKLGVQYGPLQEAQAVKMGMTFEDLATMQNQYRQTIASSGVTFSEFNRAMMANTENIDQAVFSMRDAAMVSADMAEANRLLGGDMNTLGDFMRSQSKIFHDMNKVTGITAEQFVDMNKMLRQDQSIRNIMYRQDQTRRRQYFQEIQLMTQKLIVDGLTIDQAKQVVSTLAEIGGMGAKSRVQQAARLQAVMGAAGMGREGAEAAALMRGGLRERGDKERFAEILKGAQGRMGQLMGGDIGTEMAFGGMIESLGLDKLLGPGSVMSDAMIQTNMGIDKANAEAAKSDAATKDWQIDMRNIANQTAALLQNKILQTLGSVLFGVNTIVSMMAGSKLFSMAKAGASAASSAAAQMGTTAGREALKQGFKTAIGTGGKFAISKVGAGTGIGAGLVGAGMETYENWNREDLSTARKTAMAATRGGSAAGGALGGALVGAAIGSVVPILGTTIGGLIGAAVGGLGGDMLGNTLADKLDTPKQMQLAEQQYAAIQDQKRETMAEYQALQAEQKRLREIGLEDTYKFDMINTQLANLLEVQKDLAEQEEELPDEIKKVAEAIRDADKNEDQREENRQDREDFNRLGTKDVLILRQPATGAAASR